MGYSLEPSQNAYNQEFEKVFQDAADQTDWQALDLENRKNFETDLEQLKTAGMGILANKTRAKDFSDLIEETAADVPENYDNADAQTAARDSLQAIGTQADAFLQNQEKSAGFDHALTRAAMLFWAMAVLVGTCQGGIQALSRSFFGKLIPPNRSNEYFGFFDIFGKFAAVMGPALYALVADLSGRSSYGILSLLLLFAIGLVTIIVGRKHLRQAELQGSEAAARANAAAQAAESSRTDAEKP